MRREGREEEKAECRKWGEKEWGNEEDPRGKSRSITKRKRRREGDAW